MELVHYPRSENFVMDWNRLYLRPSLLEKPTGFWVSVKGEDDWKSWCEENEFRTDTLFNEINVILKSDANILHISDMPEFREFNKEYGIPYQAAKLPNDYRSINWARVRAEYQGIIIAPYQWSARLGFDTFWYYGWDCASGCIWDLSAISTLIPSQESKLPMDSV